MNSPLNERPVDQWYLFALLGLLIGFSLIVVLVLTWHYKNASDAASVIGAALAPVSGIVGAVFGHHVGSRRRG
jgi:hypothetical protein